MGAEEQNERERGADESCLLTLRNIESAGWIGEICRLILIIMNKTMTGVEDKLTTGTVPPDMHYVFVWRVKYVAAYSNN